MKSFLMLGLWATLLVAPAVAPAAAGATRSNTAPPSRGGTIEGVALDVEGHAVEGALVAAVPENDGIDEPSTRAAALTRSDRAGRFRLSPLPAGPYSLTATKRGLAAAYLGGKSIEAGASIRAVVLRFGGPGGTVRGSIEDAKGAPIPGAQIRAIRYSDQLGDIFYANADDKGRYEITLPPARYLFGLASNGFEFKTVNVAANAGTDTTVDVTLLPPLGPPSDAVVDWIRANAVPIQTVEAGHGFSDLEPLRATIGDARVVALGEATHGTREFFQLKHRMLEFLVERMGFNVFAIEATMPEAFDLNDYVLNGRGDPERALAGLYFWTWDTQEVLDLVRWMRTWNSDPAHATKVKFYGFDMQSRPRAVKNALRAFRTIAPAEAAATAEILEPVGDPYLAERGFRVAFPSAARTAAVDSTLAALAARFDAPQGRDRALLSDRELAIARQNVRIIQQCLAMGRKGPAARDSAMAENIEWILHHEGPGAKMVVWAHNGHVSMAPPDAGGNGMGMYLHRALGREMVVFGFAFDRGGFQAIDGGAGASASSLRAFTVGPARAGAFDDGLSRAGLRVAALDLRRLPPSGAVAEWFGRTRPYRSIGAGFADSLDAQYYRTMIPAQHFDAILFVDSTSAARPNPRGVRPPLAVAAEPANLDFETGSIGSPPPGWTGPLRLTGDAYRAEIRNDDATTGSHCGLLRNLPGAVYGETYGSLRQTVAAAPYRGKRLRLAAAVRVEPGAAGGRAFLQLRATGRAPGPKRELFYDGMEDRPIVAKEWRTYTIEGDIPADAEVISFGLILVGDGSAWIDKVALEPAAPKTP